MWECASSARHARATPPFESNSNSISGDSTLTEVGRDRFRLFQRLGQIRVSACAAGEDLLGTPVGEPLAAADDGAVEARLAAVERDLDGDAEAILVRP
jgi:hypothetical protein